MAAVMAAISPASSNSTSNDWDRMAIYKRGRVSNEVQELDASGRELDVPTVYSVTTMHYFGDEHVHEFANVAGLASRSSTGRKAR
jgi:hypothetical protein